MNPNANCGDDYTVTPRMRWRVKNLRTGKVIRFRWFDAYPGMRFPRVAVGKYSSKAVVRCDGRRATRTDRFVVRQKTPKSTISIAEFRRIEIGMTRKRVRRLVGNDGRDPFTYGGVTNRTYDQMKFWAWSIIEFRKGRVHRKFWNVGHD